MEGTGVIGNLDIYAEAGSNTAYMTETPVTVSDLEINIQFVTGVPALRPMRFTRRSVNQIHCGIGVPPVMVTTAMSAVNTQAHCAL